MLYTYLIDIVYLAFEEFEENIFFKEIQTNLRFLVRRTENIEFKLVKVSFDKVFNNLCLKVVY